MSAFLALLPVTQGYLCGISFSGLTTFICCYTIEGWPPIICWGVCMRTRAEVQKSGFGMHLNFILKWWFMTIFLIRIILLSKMLFAAAEDTNIVNFAASTVWTVVTSKKRIDVFSSNISGFVSVDKFWHFVFTFWIFLPVRDKILRLMNRILTSKILYPALLLDRTSS